MKKNVKYGVTLAVMAIVVAMMVIISATIVISVNNTISYSKTRAFATELSNIQKKVDEHIISEDKDYYISDIVVDLSQMSANAKTEQFNNESLINDTVVLHVLDLNALDVRDTVYGLLKTSDDVYAVSETTNRVYYVKGFDTSGSKYYTLTNNLKAMIDISVENETLNSANISFKASSVEYTDEPITVTVMIPDIYTNIAVNTNVASVDVEGPFNSQEGYKIYEVNTSNARFNYNITVTYHVSEEEKTTYYNVDNYDGTAPVISNLNLSGSRRSSDGATSVVITGIEVSDDKSGVKSVKYSAGQVEQAKAKEYFSVAGHDVIGNSVNVVENAIIGSDSPYYTIYAEDNVGNYSVQYVDVGT